MLLLCVCAVSCTQGISVTGPSEIPEYGRGDFLVETVSAPGNPYLQEEACLDMLLTAPSGKELLLPAFWNGNGSWEARFTPQEAGRYTYRFVYRTDGGKEVRSKAKSFVSTPSNAHGILHTDGFWVLRYDDGTPFRGVGENICWESRESDDSKFFKDLHEQHDRFNYEVMLPDFTSNGGNFTRMWMCSWNFPIDRKDHFNNTRYTPSDEFYNPSAVKHLDDVLALSESLDLKIMLCMGQGDVRADRNFFSSPDDKTRFKNRLRYIVARWGYSPSVGMWEFFNEIDNIQHRNRHGVIPAEEIVAWHAEMASYLKSIDPFGHIVTTSISHRDLKGLNDVPDMDLNQKHIYKATSSIPGNIVSYGEKHGKPYVIGEFGYEWDWNKNFDDFAEDMDLDFKRGLWYGIFSPTPVTPMSWWWEFFQDRGLVPYFRNVRTVSDMMLEAGGGEFEQVKVEADGADAFAVRCGKSLFVYAYNPGKRPVTISIGSEGKLREFDFSSASFKDAAGIQPLQPRTEALYLIEQ